MAELDLTRLEKPRRHALGIEARCPACAELGRDRRGNHLLVRSDGPFACVANPNDRGHYKRIWALVGIGPEAPDRSSILRESPPREEPLASNDWSSLSVGTHEEIRALSALRGIGIEGLTLAQKRGVLRFNHCSRNGCCWVVTDDARHCRQDRRLDGKPFRLANGREVKSRSLGSSRWPVGTTAAEDFPNVIFCEGGPDLLAAYHLIWSEGREADTAAVAMMGRAIIHSSALPVFRGKHVRIFMHDDAPGREAAAKWWRTLNGIANTVDAFDFHGLRTHSGGLVNDLNDFLSADADEWESKLEVRNPLP